MKKRKDKRVKGAVRRAVYSYSRLFHVYISTALFALLIFFCVTGFFLNHLDTFGGSSEDGNFESGFDAELMSLLVQPEEDPFNQPPLPALKAYLSAHHGLTKPSNVALDAEAGEIIVDYSLPAGYASAIFVVTDELFILEYQTGNWVAIFNDLHKGRHTGGVWSWVIDLSALFMVLFALTGFILLFQNKRQRVKTLWVTVLGVVTPVIVVWLWVPAVSGVS